MKQKYYSILSQSAKTPIRLGNVDEVESDK